MVAFNSSEFRGGEFIIDDNNFHQYAPNADIIVGGEVRNRGRIPRDWNRIPHGSIPCAPVFPAELYIPEEEWDERIEEMERTKTRLSDLILATYNTPTPLTSLDQNGTNYCWCNAVITALEIMQLVAGDPMERLSPASVAAIIKGYRNQGGWGGDALEYIVDHGVATTRLWPANYWQNSHYDTAECRQYRVRNIVTEFYDIASRDFRAKMSLLLRRLPVPSGYNWWSHETCGVDPVKIGPKQYGSRERNSWSDSYGDRGFFILSQAKSTPDDAVSPRVKLPTPMNTAV